MHIAFLNIQGNFDPQDRYWTAHPDFGGQLVYVKEVALALGRMGHDVDIVTRRIRDPQWPGFETDIDGYPGEPNVRIVRLPCGGDRFLRKQELWPYIGPEWVPNLIDFYRREGRQPAAATSHYGDAGLAAAIWQQQGGPPYTFTAHSLGAQKLERLLIYNHADITSLDREYFFARRIVAERVAMNHSACVITSTHQERHDQYGHLAYAGAFGNDDTDRFAVIPPGVNLDIFDAGVHGPHDGRIADRIEQALSRDVSEERRGLPLVVCSSRLEPKKNHIGLVLAFARSEELQAAANLLFVVRGLGDIRQRTGLRKDERHIMDKVAAACESANLWGKVAGCSLDGQTELAAAYRYLAGRRSVFALPALYEPFGLAPLEAIAAGLPACVTRCGGPSESLYDEKTDSAYGVLVDPADPSAIAAGLLKLVGPDNDWESYRDAGRRRVLEKYTWDATARSYLGVLEAMANHPVKRSGMIPIPGYFLDPDPQSDISIDLLGPFCVHE
ncbi:MAG: glycosyltransferase [Gammaproteobacteria bacterium]